MNLLRREFLAVGSALLAGAGSAVAADAKRKFTIDLRWGSIGVKTDQVGAIELAAKHGFESVAASPYELAKLSDAQSDEIVGLLKAKGLVWGSAGLPVEFRQDAARFEDDLKQLPERAAAIQRAGGSRMGTWLMPCHDELTYMANFKQHATRLREVAKILKDNGLGFGLEYVGTQSLRVSKKYPFVHTMKETLDLHDQIGVDNMGLVLDSWHWFTAGESADEIRQLNASQVVGCDLNDAPKGRSMAEQQDDERELPAATGVIDVKSFLDALVAIGYDGPVRAEPFNQPLNQLDNDAACSKTAAAIKKAFNQIG
ncbi:MAG: sugar phosphate isomerase/epimerase family protein [Planctomycetota bacterium]